MNRFDIQRSLLAVLLLIVFLPGALEAQRRGRGQQQVPTGPWAPISIGAHAGYDEASNGTVLGAQIRAPIVRNGKIELMPSGSVTFLTGLKEYQFNLDAVFVTGGRAGGLYAAGGLAVRNTIFLDQPGQQTRTGFGWAVGIRSGSGSRVGMQLEVRQIFVDADLRPRLLTFGLNFALWGGEPRRGG